MTLSFVIALDYTCRELVDESNMEFRLRVYTAVEFLVGAKMSKSNFLACSVLCFVYVYNSQFYLKLLNEFLFL